MIEGRYVYGVFAGECPCIVVYGSNEKGIGPDNTSNQWRCSSWKEVDDGFCVNRLFAEG